MFITFGMYLACAIWGFVRLDYVILINNITYFLNSFN